MLRTVCWRWWALVAILFVPVSASAQVDRHELGRRVRQFERVFANANPETRAAATVDALKSAVSSFFSLQLSAAGAHLMAAQRALEPRNGPLQAYADSLFLQPGSRAVDVKATELPFRVRGFFKMESAPDQARIAVTLCPPGPRAKPVAQVEMKLGELPQSGTLQLDPKALRAGDGWVLRARLVGKGTAPIGETTLSLVENLKDRVARLKQAVDGLDPKTTRGATVRAHYRLVRALSGKRTLETDYPVAALLARAEKDVAADGETLRRGAGQHWLTLAAGRRRVAVRVGIPKAALARTDPVPLVLALHGAGGSENMFFDTYGDGEVWRLAKARGWIVCAPRQGLTGSPLPELVAELRKIVPVRTDRIFVVGHSMGAGQAIAATCARPAFYRAVAALGGGGRVRRTDALKKLPFFVAAGAADFGRSGARRLQRDLVAAGASASYRDYPDIEHLAIVQVALPDVFSFFDQRL